MVRTRSRELDFESLEKAVRWIEETDPEAFPAALERRLQKLRPDQLDSHFLSAALATVRSVRHSTNTRVPHGLLAMASARALATGGAQSAPQVMAHILRLVHAEINDPGFGPYRLLQFDEVAGEGKEGTLFSFVEAVRAGDTDWADHRFAWLVRNQEKEQIVDTLISSGLEGVTGGSHKIIFVVEIAALLHGLGWQWAPILLRPVVRHQAGFPAVLGDFEACRELVARHELLKLARRRSPGQPALGEADPESFLQRSILWAESEPEARSRQVAAALVEGAALEDIGDLLLLGATLLFLQETLRPAVEGVDGAEDLDRRVHLVTAAASLRQLVRLGTPGQRILGLLLAGWVPPLRDARLEPRSPDCGWWLPPLTRLLEPSQAAPAKEERGSFEELSEMILGRQTNGLLPILSARLEQGRSVAGAEETLAQLAPRFEYAAPGLSMKLHYTLAEAYRTARTPHRWAHLWAAGLSLTAWPRPDETGGLQAVRTGV